MTDRLVGRERELALLADVVHRAAGGERSVVVITGEPGIGKSTLLHHLADRAATTGVRCVWGRTSEVGLTPAFWPWMQILAALSHPDDPAPELDSTDETAEPGVRLARFERVAAFLRRRAADATLALLFDDAHAADPSSLQLLEHAIPILAGSRIAIAIAARGTDAGRSTAAALGRLQRGATRVVLSRLGRTDVERMLPARLDAATVARVWELSEGNPLFVEELVASASAEGVVRLPQLSSVRSVISERAARLPASTRAVLLAAAVVGRDLRAAVVADMLGVVDDEISDRLAPAVHLGMVARVSGDKFRFSHALVAEALGDELEPSERARLHLRAAQAIERRDGGEVSAVAHHLLAAGHLAAEAAVAAAERAASAASAQLAFEDAAALLERAVAALALAAPDDRRRKAGLVLAWAEALHHAGQHARANELCDHVLESAGSLADDAVFVRAALVRGLEFRYGTTDPRLVDVLIQALAIVNPADVASRARLLARLAAAEQPAADPWGPVARAREAIALAAGLDDRDRLQVVHTAVSALVEFVPPSELRETLVDAVEIATRIGARTLAIHGRVRLCFNSIEQGDRAAYEHQLAALRPQVDALGLSRWRRTALLMESLTALLDGRWRDAAAYVEDAERLGPVDGPTRFLFDVHRAFCAASRTQRLGADVAPSFEAYGQQRAEVAAWLATHRDDEDEMGRAVARIAPGTLSAEVASFASDAIVRVGTPEQARAAYRTLLPYAGRPAVTTMVGSAVADLHDRALLVLAARLDEWDMIDAHGESGLQVAARIASAPLAARLRADWADALERRARAGDAARSSELRAAAFETAVRLDMPRLRARLEAPTTTPPSARPTTSIPSMPSPASGAAISFERSGELWVIRGLGEQVHVKDSRGIHMLARLVAEPRRELHALDLSGSSGEVDGGDAGDVLDDATRTAYRDRLHTLGELREDAEARGDLGRLERVIAEIEALTDELERSMGLGGRGRRAGSNIERARSNVQRRISHAIQQIRAASPKLGSHLSMRVRTGAYCAYEPED